MIYSISAHGPGNAGDVVIQYAISQMLKKHTNDTVTPVPDWHMTTDDMVIKYNKANALFIGGGGLLLKDSQPNKTSGWRWNITLEQLDRIKSPIIVFGIGYNRFRGQDDYDPIFYEHLHTLVEKAVFFSTREKWTPLHDFSWGAKIKYQPCPAVMLNTMRKYKPATKRMVFVPALDRINMRYTDVEQFHIEIANILRGLAKSGWEVNIAYHVSIDKLSEKYFNEFRQVDLTEKDAYEILEFYETVEAVISLRLHGLIIPFGLGCNKIIPINTHDKITDFATSNGIPYLDTNEIELIPELLQKEFDYHSARSIASSITLENLEIISPYLNNQSGFIKVVKDLMNLWKS